MGNKEGNKAGDKSELIALTNEKEYQHIWANDGHTCELHG